jgi:hypothetical protein
MLNGVITFGHRGENIFAASKDYLFQGTKDRDK